MRLRLGFAVAALALVVSPGWSGSTESKQAARAVVAAVEAREADGAPQNAYIGSEACLACHPNYASWRDTLHATGLKTAPDARFSMKVKNGIVADYDKNGVDDFKQGLDFNAISSVFDPYKPNAPVLGYSDGKGYWIRIGQVEYPLAFVHGGSGVYKQRFLVRMPVTDTASGWSAGTYYSPIQFNESTKAYVLYEPAYWYDGERKPKFSGPITAAVAAAGKSFDKGCAGCHATAMTSIGKDENGEYLSTTPTPVYVKDGDPHYLDLRGRGEPDMYNIGCERCHGPGARHVINRGDPKRIVSPARDFTAKQQNFQCGSCHSRGFSMPQGTYEYPYDETTRAEFPRFAPTEDLFTKYLQEKPGRYPDGKTSRQHHQQLQDLMLSSKWEFQYHKVTCTDCHDPHKATRGQIRETLTTQGSGGATLTMNVAVSDNSLCLGCHASFGPFESLKKEQIADLKSNREVVAQVVSAHTHHPYNPEAQSGLSRCTTCHMAQMGTSGAPYDMHSHTFEVVPPERTLKYQSEGGMPNSCATCHRETAAGIGAPPDASLSTWNEKSDVAVAEWLMKYYGPEGTWWKTAPEASK